MSLTRIKRADAQHSVVDEEKIVIKDSQVYFKYVRDSERAEKFGRLSDGKVTRFLNTAIDYFGNRCALSGERFYAYNGKVGGKKSNLSVEHIIPLCIGGQDIIPNMVPSIFHYNMKKRNMYLLDYWLQQKDIKGKRIYSTHRLLKLVNYMMKSISARGVSYKEYRRIIMEPNELDEYLIHIEQEDLNEPDNSKRKILSDTETTTQLNEDNEHILAIVPEFEGNKIEQYNAKEQQNYEEMEMINLFLCDAIRLIEEDSDVGNHELILKNGLKITIVDKLNNMLAQIDGVISFEIVVRNAVVDCLKELRNKKCIHSSK